MAGDFKNDFQNALKRNLHNWSQWRTDINDRLVTSLMTGASQPRVDALDNYLLNTYHPVENPKTLITYSAAGDNISALENNSFLRYGIPRAKLSLRRSTNLPVAREETLRDEWEQTDAAVAERLDTLRLRSDGEEWRGPNDDVTDDEDIPDHEARKRDVPTLRHSQTSGAVFDAHTRHKYRPARSTGVYSSQRDLHLPSRDMTPRGYESVYGVRTFQQNIY